MKTLGQFLEEARKKVDKTTSPLAQIPQQVTSADQGPSTPVYEDDKTLSRFMQDIQSTLDKTHQSRKSAPKEKDTELLYFAYGHNTDTETFHARCIGATALGVGVLDDFRMYFEEYANIRMEEGAATKGVVWKIKANQINNLDGYEALHKDYNRIPVEVNLKGKNVECIAYIMDPKFEISKIHTKPTREYVDNVAKGYVEHGIPLQQLKDGLKRS
jgi:gamma-glutamylcyclotransferase (GGCT)/AIG2-like uncharacterized protein YtfP